MAQKYYHILLYRVFIFSNFLKSKKTLNVCSLVFCDPRYMINIFLFIFNQQLVHLNPLLRMTYIVVLKNTSFFLNELYE